MRPAHCVVTRPADEAATWVRALQQRGIAAVALPLIAVCPVADPQAVQALWARMGSYDAVMFVSAAAAVHAFACRPATADLPAQAWAPGPATAAALGRCGVPHARIRQPASDAVQWDSESLWRVVGPGVGAGMRVLVVRGADDERESMRPAGAVPTGGTGREWLTAQLRAAGAQVDHVAAYRRIPPSWDASRQQEAAALQGPQVLWLFSSSHALRNLRALMPALDWSATQALATHPRIAEAARRAGFGVVWPSRPAVADVITVIESIR